MFENLEAGLTVEEVMEEFAIAIVVLGNPQPPAVHRYIDRVVAAVNAATAGSDTEVEIPYQ